MKAYTVTIKSKNKKRVIEVLASHTCEAITFVLNNLELPDGKYCISGAPA